jgi:hypothetical protein
VTTRRRNRLGSRKENLFLLAAYNVARDWNAARREGNADEHGVMGAAFEGLGIDDAPDSDDEQ